LPIVMDNSATASAAKPAAFTQTGPLSRFKRIGIEARDAPE
jgi:hypothetical protein